MVNGSWKSIKTCFLGVSQKLLVFFLVVLPRLIRFLKTFSVKDSKKIFYFAKDFEHFFSAIFLFLDQK